MTHAGLWGTDSIMTPSGRPVPAGVPFTVYDQGTDDLAVLWVDADRFAAADNPGVIGEHGNLAFFAEPGLYDLTIGETTLLVQVPTYPGDGGGGSGAVSAGDVTGDWAAVGLVSLDVQGAITEAVTGFEAGLDDHVHPMPSAADVGAVPITAIGMLDGETNRGDWSGATAYVVGDVVHDHAAGGLYVCAVANTNEQPSATPLKWTAIDGTGRQLALGPGGSATGALAASVGFAAEASAANTTAVGHRGAASAVNATEVGAYGSASGIAATAVGALTNAAGNATTAVGFGASAPTDGDVNLANIITGHIDVAGESFVGDAAITVVSGAIDLPETADATDPAAGVQRLVARTDGLYVRDEAGTEVGPIGSGVPQLAFTAAAYYTLGGNESIHSSVSPDTVGAMTAHPVWLDAGSYDRETVTATVAAVSTWRLGVFADSGSLSPGARLLDAGALNMNSGTGARELSVTITIPTSGVYWLALLVDAYTARPTSCGWMGATGGTPNLPWVGHRGIMNPGGRGQWAARATGVATGAIPATFPGGHSWTDTTPQIALRRA